MQDETGTLAPTMDNLTISSSIMESTMTTGDDESPRTGFLTKALQEQQQEPDDEVSVVSTSGSFSSVDGSDEPTCGLPKPKKTLWKDKNGQARYVAGDIPLKPATDRRTMQGRQAVAAAAVTASVATGAVVGLVVLGPVGLAVGGLASAGSAASAFVATRRHKWTLPEQLQQLRRLGQPNAQRQEEEREKEQQLKASSLAPPVAEPPCRRYTSVHEKEDKEAAAIAAAVATLEETNATHVNLKKGTVVDC